MSLQPTNLSGDDTMDLEEAAAYLGIDPFRVVSLVRSKRLPGTRVAGRWRLPRRELESWKHRKNERQQSLDQQRQDIRNLLLQPGLQQATAGMKEFDDLAMIEHLEVPEYWLEEC